MHIRTNHGFLTMWAGMLQGLLYLLAHLVKMFFITAYYWEANLYRLISKRTAFIVKDNMKHTIRIRKSKAAECAYATSYTLFTQVTRDNGENKSPFILPVQRFQLSRDERYRFTKPTATFHKPEFPTTCRNKLICLLRTTCLLTKRKYLIATKSSNIKCQYTPQFDYDAPASKKHFWLIKATLLFVLSY